MLISSTVQPIFTTQLLHLTPLMKNRLLLVTAAASMAAASAQAQQTNIKFTEYDLPNGLHVILHRDNSTPIVATSVMYHVGSKNERPDRTGFAHFFEHLLFEGSENLGRGEYMKTIQNAGGQLNANTTTDRTYYYEVLPSNQLELSLYMESERMLHSKIDTKGVETQREVVKEEKRMRYDNQPYGSVFPTMVKEAFKVHPYRWTPIGEMEHLNAAKLEEFVQFYKDFYVPQNAILSIAGDLDIEKTKALVARYFGEIPRGAKAIYRPTDVEPQQTAERRDTVYDNISLPAVIAGYHIPKQGTPDFYALSMLTDYLSNGNSAALNKEVKDRQQKALAVFAFPMPSEDPGLYMSYAIANAGVDPKELLSSVDAEVEKVQKTLISEHEFQRVRNQVETEFVTKSASVRGIAEQLAQYKMYFGDANLINTEIDRYRAVTRQDIQRVAQKYLAPTNRTVLIYLPKQKNG